MSKRKQLNLYPSGYWFVIDEFGHFFSGPWLSRALLLQYIRRRFPKRSAEMRLHRFILTPAPKPKKRKNAK